MHCLYKDVSKAIWYYFLLLVPLYTITFMSRFKAILPTERTVLNISETETEYSYCHLTYKHQFWSYWRYIWFYKEINILSRIFLLSNIISQFKRSVLSIFFSFVCFCHRKEGSYICNFKEHWLTIRKIGIQWFNLNSLLEGPEILSETYLGMFLTQLQGEGKLLQLLLLRRMFDLFLLYLDWKNYIHLSSNEGFQLKGRCNKMFAAKCWFVIDMQ